MAAMHCNAGVLPRTILIGVALLIASLPTFAEERLVSIGDRRLSIDCDGEPGSPTVVLIAGGGKTAEDWVKVQPAVAKFARVCSYDRAGFGTSDKVPYAIQPLDDVVNDLHQLLTASGEQGPYILVGHSVAGIYARSYTTRFPNEVAGLVFVDSAHEEQTLRFHQLDPTWQPLDQESAEWGLYITPGQRLQWQTELPVIVLGHGIPIQGPKKVSPETATGRERIWNQMQTDLAVRSARGELRIAEHSGHNIHLEQPELVIQAIRDVLSE